LDHVISLEAALLPNTGSELFYKFRLYGALFLADRRDATTTFADLKRVYAVRSSLVHGTPVKPTERQAARHDASELARAVLLKALETGWPEPLQLDAAAIASPLSNS
jgi:hypothetical protein